jgi:hypothetical protein
MSVSDTQKVDLLYKKYFGVAKTDLATNKSPSNEAIASPALSRIDRLWTQALSIPATAAATAGIVQAYTGASAVQCTADTTTTPISSVYPSWKTNLPDWIPSEFGSTYFVQVWVDSSGVGNPTATGTQIFDSGSGGTGEWNFDYVSGVLNFIGGTIPTALTSSKVIYVVGYRYIGLKATNFSNISVGNINISGNTISSTSGNVYITGNLTINGPAVSIGTSDLAIQDPILNLHTYANLAPLTYNDGYDIGLKLHYYDTVDSAAFLGRANDSGFLEWYSRGSDVANVFVGTVYGTIKTGELLLANTTPATGANTGGALRVWGDAAIAGNIYTGNILSSGYRFANGVPLTNLTLSNVGTYLTTYTGNLSAGNISGNIFADTISPLVTRITVFNSTAAIGLPAGTNAQYPVANIAGYFRYNTSVSTVEFYNGSSWIPFTNTINDQQITPDGINASFTLNQASAAEGLLVSINGTVQRPGVAYTVAGTTITFAEIPAVTDIIDLRYIASATAVTLTGLGEDIGTTGNIVGNVIQANIITALVFNGNLTGNLVGNIQANTVSANTTVVSSANITVSTANVIVDSFNTSKYRGARYTVSSSNAYDSQIAEVNLVQMGGTALVSVFGIVNTGANTVSFGANINGSTVNLLAIGTAAANQLRIQRTYFSV